jgi:hypothetical protein
MSLWRRRGEFLGFLEPLSACQWPDVQVSWNSSPDLNSPCPLQDIEMPLSRFYQGAVVQQDQSKMHQRKGGTVGDWRAILPVSRCRSGGGSIV